MNAIMVKKRKPKGKMAICLNCKKPFQSWYNKREQKFCSTKCARSFLYAIHFEQRQLRRNAINKSERICRKCGKVFPVSSSMRRDKKYCSDSCTPKDPTTKKEIVDTMRNDFDDLKKRNPKLAQQIADEMKIVEGKQFQKDALDV